RDHGDRCCQPDCRDILEAVRAVRFQNQFDPGQQGADPVLCSSQENKLSSAFLSRRRWMRFAEESCRRSLKKSSEFQRSTSCQLSSWCAYLSHVYCRGLN